MLFLGEWLFGSIGWGVLLGTELLIAVAVTAIVVALRVPRLGFQVLVAVLIGLAVGLVFGVSLTYRLFSALGDALNVPTEPGYAAAIAGVVAGAVLGILARLHRLAFGVVARRWRPGGRDAGPRRGRGRGGRCARRRRGGPPDRRLDWRRRRPRATAVVAVAAIGALAGLIAGYRAGRGGTAAIYGLVAGTIGGVVVGAILGVDYGPRIGAAAGVATFLLAWPLLMLLRLKREGIDGEALKRRFMPQATIDTTKESIEWAKARLPLGPKS